MSDPTSRFWGYDLGRRASLRSGVLYPMLHRLLDEGWLVDGWEEPAPAGKRKAPPRRYYELTELGATNLGAVLAARAAGMPLRSWQPRFA
jgi:PadR family transcriptional regulator PadR